MLKKGHHRSKKDTGQEQWSDWYEHEDGYEYRVRLNANGGYTDDYDCRAHQGASPADEKINPAVSQKPKDDYRGRSWEQDGAPHHRDATSTSPSKDVKPPPPPPPFQKSVTYRPSTPPSSPQPPSSTSGPYYTHTAASARAKDTERTSASFRNSKEVGVWEEEPLCIAVEDRMVRAIPTTNTECFVTSEFADLLQLPTQTSSQSKRFAHLVKGIPTREMKTKERIEADIDYNGKRIELQRLYILPKDSRLDGAVFLSSKVVDHLQKAKKDTRSASMVLPVRGSGQYQTSYFSTNPSRRMERTEQDPRSLSSAPADDYDPGLQRPYDNPSSKHNPQQSSKSTDYDGRGFDSRYGSRLLDPGFTASPPTESHSYGASASSDTSSYRK